MEVPDRSRPVPGWPDLVALAVLAVTVGVGLAARPALPAEMVVGWRWGLDGELVRTYGPRIVGVLAVPALAGTLYALFRAVCVVTPLENRRSRRRYDGAVLALLALCCTLQGWLLWMNIAG